MVAKELEISTSWNEKKINVSVLRCRAKKDFGTAGMDTLENRVWRN